MKEKKNIDRLFQEKFKNFEAHPSDRVWDNIAAAQKKKDNRKIIPLWWRVGGIAAALLLLFGLGTILIPSSDESNTQIVEESTITTDDTEANAVKNADALVSQEVNETDTNEANPSRDGVTSSSTSQNTTTKNSVDYDEVVATSTGDASSNYKETNNSVENNKRLTQKAQTSNKGLIAYQEATRVGNDNNNITNSNKKSPINGENEHAPLIKENSEGIAQVSTPETKENKKKDLVAEAQKIEASKEEEAIAQLDEKPTINRWDVGAVAAPVYYGDFGGSGLDKQFADNDKTGDVNLSYGVQVSYAISPKLKIRTGVNSVDLSYNTNEISFSTNGLGRRVQGIAYSDNARSLAISDNSSSNVDNFQADGIVPRMGLTAAGSLEQQLSYLEIPVEAVYVISDKRIGVSVVGGVSTLLLNDNDVILRSTELTTSLGTASGVNDLSFTTNIGVGLDYKMTENFIFNIEPSLKYQLNSFDNTVVDFKPYFLGLYTGVSYKF